MNDIAHLTRTLVSQLTPDLLQPQYRARNSVNKLFGHCSVAAESLYHLLGGQQSGWVPQNIQHEGVQHWYLKHRHTGKFLDPTAGQFRTPVPYHMGRGRGFPTPKQGGDVQPPSKRAKVLIERVKNELARQNSPLQKGLPGLMAAGMLAAAPGPTSDPSALQSKPDASHELVLTSADHSVQPKPPKWDPSTLHPDLLPIAHLESSFGQNMQHAPSIKGDWDTAYGPVGFKPSTAHDQYIKTPTLKARYPGLEDPALFSQRFKTDWKFHHAVAGAHFSTLQHRLGSLERAVYGWRHGAGAAAKATEEQIQHEPYVSRYRDLAASLGTNRRIAALGKSQREKELVRVVSVAAYDDGSLLFGKRHDSGKWCLPGGHLEPGESKLEGAQRELYEETGLEGTDWKYLGVELVPGKDVQVYCYKCKAVGKPTGSNDPDEEFVDYKWCDPHNLPKDVRNNLHNEQDVNLKLQDIDHDLRKSYPGPLATDETDTLLHMLKELDDPIERALALKHHGVKAHHLRAALSDEDPTIRELAVTHRAMTPELLHEILTYGDDHMIETALSRLDLDENQLKHVAFNPNFAHLVVNHPGCTADLRSHMANHPDITPDVQAQALAKSIPVIPTGHDDYLLARLAHEDPVAHAHVMKLAEVVGHKSPINNLHAYLTDVRHRNAVDTALGEDVDHKDSYSRAHQALKTLARMDVSEDTGPKPFHRQVEQWLSSHCTSGPLAAARR